MGYTGSMTMGALVSFLMYLFQIMSPVIIVSQFFNELSRTSGAANIYTTPKDYYKIQLGLTNGKILSQKQFDELTHLKYRTNSYSGGLYIKKNGKLKMAYGNLHGTHFGNWFQMTNDNKNGLVMFLNQTQNDENRNKDIGYEILNRIKPNTFSNR